MCSSSAVYEGKLGLIQIELDNMAKAKDVPTELVDRLNADTDENLLEHEIEKDKTVVPLWERHHPNDNPWFFDQPEKI